MDNTALKEMQGVTLDNVTCSLEKNKWNGRYSNRRDGKHVLGSTRAN
jgi:hypothetical protein